MLAVSLEKNKESQYSTKKLKEGRPTVCTVPKLLYHPTAPSSLQVDEGTYDPGLQQRHLNNKHLIAEKMMQEGDCVPLALDVQCSII